MSELTMPAEWLEILTAVQSVDSNAILMGGALRDLDNDREVKDLDIFVSRNADMNLIGDELFPFRPLSNYVVPGGYLGSEVVEVHMFGSVDDAKVPVNIIKLIYDDPLRHFFEMDFGLCQIGYLHGQVIRSHHYVYDVISNVLTLRRADDQPGFDRSMERYKRLSAKYEWPLRVPEKFQHLAA